jgi:hypothetical protein
MKKLTYCQEEAKLNKEILDLESDNINCSSVMYVDDDGSTRVLLGKYKINRKIDILSQLVSKYKRIRKITNTLEKLGELDLLPKVVNQEITLMTVRNTPIVKPYQTLRSYVWKGKEVK